MKSNGTLEEHFIQAQTLGAITRENSVCSPPGGSMATALCCVRKYEIKNSLFI